MSLISDAANDAGLQSENDAGKNRSFRFVPKELAAKCGKLIESYHAIHGYACLADMLWQSDARNIIECEHDLAQIFKRACKSRCAKRANDSLALIATTIVSLEALARDFAGWGKRFPAAKREAEKMLGDFPVRQRVWFMDMYLYPSLGIHRELANTLAPSAPEPSPIRN